MHLEVREGVSMKSMIRFFFQRRSWRSPHLLCLPLVLRQGVMKENLIVHSSHRNLDRSQSPQVTGHR
jgi:hypothetical protein